MLSLIWVTDNLAVGPAPSKFGLEQLKEFGIDAVIDIRSEGCDDTDILKELDIDFLHVEVDDMHSPTRNQMYSIFDFADPLLDKNNRIFVHCQNGYGRSPLTIVAILASRGMDVQSAVSLIYEKHPTATFTAVQEKFIYDLENILDRKDFR